MLTFNSHINVKTKMLETLTGSTCNKVEETFTSPTKGSVGPLPIQLRPSSHQNSARQTGCIYRVNRTHHYVQSRNNALRSPSPRDHNKTIEDYQHKEFGLTTLRCGQFPTLQLFFNSLYYSLNHIMITFSYKINHQIFIINKHSKQRCYY